MKTMKDPIYREIENLLRIGSQKLRQKSTSEALDCFQRAYQQAIRLSDASVIRSCAFNLGACMVTMNEFEKAVRYLQLVLPSDGAEKPVPYVADVHFNIGVAHEKLGNHEASQEAFRHAYVFYRKNENYQLQVEVAFRIARHSESQKNIQEARAYYRSAMEACHNDPTMLEWHLRSMVKYAFCSCVLGDPSPAEQLMTQCQKEAHLIPNAERRIAVLNEMGITLMYASRYAAAKECFQAGLDCISDSTTRDPEFQRAAFLQNMAAAHTALEQFDEAVERYNQALQHFDQADTFNILGRAHCSLNAALCHARLSGAGHMLTARELYMTALKLAKEAGDSETQWQALEGLGAVEFTTGNTVTAAGHFAEALTLVEESATPSRQRVAAKLEQTRRLIDSREAGHQPVRQTDEAKSDSSSSSSSDKAERKAFDQLKQDDAAKDNTDGVTTEVCHSQHAGDTETLSRRPLSPSRSAEMRRTSLSLPVEVGDDEKKPAEAWQQHGNSDNVSPPSRRHSETNQPEVVNATTNRQRKDSSGSCSSCSSSGSSYTGSSISSYGSSAGLGDSLADSRGRDRLGTGASGTEQQRKSGVHFSSSDTPAGGSETAWSTRRELAVL